MQRGGLIKAFAGGEDGEDRVGALAATVPQLGGAKIKNLPPGPWDDSLPIVCHESAIGA
jgi:hypothetical protein